MTGVVRFESTSWARPAGDLALSQVSWSIQDGEVWAVVGPVGSGKTTLTEALLGRLNLIAGSADWPILERCRSLGKPAAFPGDVIHRVGFKEESRAFSYGKHYYQQRFNFIEPDDDLTLEQFLRTGFHGPDAELERVCDRFELQELRSLSLIKLSNGQTRRSRIARALLTRPELLILDEPFVGLDAHNRAEVENALRGLVADGARLVVIADESTLPDWVTHVIRLDHGVVRTAGPRSQQRASIGGTRPLKGVGSASERMPVVELENVTVRHGDRTILDRVTWTVRQGDRWAIVGPNGSGKTTLLSLICGDHPQAYSNVVRLFGRQRGTGESIWDIKRQVGLVSPELHFYFSTPLTARRAAATGFFDVLVPRPTTPDQDRVVDDLLQFFGVADEADRSFAHLSTGQQRIVLLVRALVKMPPLLVLDEPFQVLDAITIERARHWIDNHLPDDRTVLFVTHQEAELPRSMTHRLRLLPHGLIDQST